MNKRFFIFFICLVIFITILSISIVVLSSSNKDNKNEKIEQEIDFVEEKLIGMINSLNNISFSNSVLLEQNTIKGQENSSSKNQGSEEEGSSSTNGSEGGSSSNSNESENSTSSQSQNNSLTNSAQGEKGTDYSKYNVENKNILIESQDKIDWNYLKNNVEIIYSSWPTIMIDLHSINIKNEDILAFSNSLDALVISLEKEDKRETLNNLASLYALMPIYTQQFTEDIEKINIAYTKSCIINAYVLLEDDRWDDMQNEIINAINYFDTIINSINMEKQQSTISKIYILLNDINNSIKIRDKKLFYLKYVNLMENATII